MQMYMKEAIAEAMQGLAEGGIPIGAVLVREGKIIGRGHNRRVQNGDPTAHADCLKQCGRIGNYKDTVLYSTLMPCTMCAGATVLFRIPVLVAGENRTFAAAHEWMVSRAVRVIDLNLDQCYDMLQQFAREQPAIWAEDIGEL
jgi:cytosine deaminase